jgi:hypothetical protein
MPYADLEEYSGFPDDCPRQQLLALDRRFS